MLGRSLGDFLGYKWNGTNWDVDYAIVENLPDIGSISTPSVFQMDTNWYMLSGNYPSNSNGFVFN
jgi:hypothetical protein